MIDISCECVDLPERHFEPGEVILKEGGETGFLYFLKEGKVEIQRSGEKIAESDQPGSIFGEISILLGRPHMADVIALEKCTFHVAEDAESYLRDHPEVNIHISRDLARKVDQLSCYLVDIKQQFADETNHLGMVHEVLDTLMQLPSGR